MHANNPNKLERPNLENECKRFPILCCIDLTLKPADLISLEQKDQDFTKRVRNRIAGHFLPTVLAPPITN
jgi:hypothetical protein